MHSKQLQQAGHAAAACLLPVLAGNGAAAGRVRVRRHGGRERAGAGRAGRRGRAGQQEALCTTSERAAWYHAIARARDLPRETGRSFEGFFRISRVCPSLPRRRRRRRKLILAGTLLLVLVLRLLLLLLLGDFGCLELEDAFAIVKAIDTALPLAILVVVVDASSYLDMPGTSLRSHCSAAAPHSAHTAPPRAERTPRSRGHVTAQTWSREALSWAVKDFSVPLIIALLPVRSQWGRRVATVVTAAVGLLAP